MAWTVEFTGKAQKQYDRLPEKIQLIVAALTAELETEGPSQPEWRHFGGSRGAPIATTAISRLDGRPM
jgi:mRNA-degrading endonuclease RelE of RelBE toxin-antitoxin system